ncbi:MULTISPECIES: hypothetical protein [Legionella]|uniref:DUF420 domain-containing protein n=1 Tax=Legionella septentrionalis TaxID=2498109 RepID=A0A433JI85_9GAMM|nr:MULTISPECIES: hypothetical protein [Legionella]MCP0913234.1 hypothetical protein [Legionella sp. 27cVA30]RUQ84974.1 hypothetical protein EKM59_07900 [Legionella septentrionalis]RUR02390.1 hypothetical protein ELY11_01285 [Legionella septentrionalis]RUR10333.1 hypothetical protein ELY14_05530 [Legionella septentrionalis]RUR17047.1 hypothetical protein ELY10_01480 [Legionella septentrionalis]
MLILAIIVFALAASLGIFLLSYVLQGKNTPKGVAIIHGFFAATGIVLLIVYSFFYQGPLAALTVFILAALGGFVLFYKDITGGNIPKAFALGHGSIAVIGFILLILFTIRSV